MEDLILLEDLTLLKTIYKFNATPSKSQWQFLQNIKKKKILRFIWNNERPGTAKVVLKKNKAGGLPLPDFKIYLFKAAVIITVYYRHKDRHQPTEQNTEPRIKLSHIQSTYLQQGCQEDTMGKRQPLQQMVLGKLNIHEQNNKTRPLSYTRHKNKLRIGSRLKHQT